MGIELGSQWQVSPGDLEKFRATMHTVEQACAALQVPSTRAIGESALLAFRRSPQPIKACQYILENSQVAVARFQAAATIQEAAIREWVLLSAEEKDNLRIYCLHYVMARAEAPEGYVQAKVLSVVAVLLKRGWLDFIATEKEHFFNEVRQAVVGMHGIAAQRSGIALLESLVSEFSPSTASAMGLSAEFHEHCRASLEHEYLLKFYLWARDAAKITGEKALQTSGNDQEVHICAMALRLMSQILSWEFHGSLTRGSKTRNNLFFSSANRDNNSSKRTGEFASLIQPSPAWQEILPSIPWVLGFYSLIRQHGLGGNDWMESPLAVSARQLTVQLCSLSGKIFPSDGGTSQELHLQQMLHGISSWLNPPEIISKTLLSNFSESELLDGCHALVAIASQSSPSSFDQLMKPASGLNFLASLTCEAIRACDLCDASGNPEKEDTTWPNEVLDILLDIWTVLLQPADFSRRILFPSNGVEAAAAVFRVYIEFELKVAAKSAYEGDDEEDQSPSAIDARDERLAAVALIARASSSSSVPLLSMLVVERFNRLHQHLGENGDPTPILEELYWLVLMSGHVLADSGQGETPVMPDSITSLCSPTSNPMDHPAVILSRSVIELANSRDDILSPRLMEAVVWFFGRWADTYLMPLDAGRGPNSTPSGHEGDQHPSVHSTQIDGRHSLVSAFGKGGDGAVVLEVLVRLAISVLTRWPGEIYLQELVCFQLLPALVRRRNICSQLVSTDAWQKLANAFASQDLALLSLAGPVQRALSEGLCRSAAGMTSGDATNQYVKDLLGPIAASIETISKSNDLHSFSQRPDVILQVTCLIERLRGAARATLPRSQKAVFELGTAVMEPLLLLLQVYKNQSAVIYVLLKYVVDWVDGQIAFLESKEIAIVFNFCVRLLEIYHAHNIGKISVSKSTNLLSESENEKYKDLRALLQLLTNLSSKDLIDFSSDSNAEVENPDIAQIVYLGLHIVTPLMSVELLKYPKLCRQYFNLLSHMLEVYPEKVAKLSPQGFSQIVSTLEFGLKHQDVEVVNMTLVALNAIAFFHFQAICRGQEGLGVHVQGDSVTKEGVLAYFLKALMHFLLFEDYSNELVDPAADALLPLILCNNSLYQGLAQEIIQGQKHIDIQTRLVGAFHHLLNGNQITASLDRVNRRKFRENMYHFLAEVRGFLRTK